MVDGAVPLPHREGRSEPRRPARVPLRNFTARDLYVRRGGPIRRPEDLAGRRIGMYSYTASGSIWYRHFLRFVGLDPAAIEWWIGDIDTPWSAPMDVTLPRA